MPTPRSKQPESKPTPQPKTKRKQTKKKDHREPTQKALSLAESVEGLTSRQVVQSRFAMMRAVERGELAIVYRIQDDNEVEGLSKGDTLFAKISKHNSGAMFMTSVTLTGVSKIRFSR